MKKKYTSQIYEEGLGATVYVPVDDAIKSKKNQKAKKVLGISWKIIYTILAILMALLLFWLTFPLK